MDFVIPALALGLKHSFDPDHLLAVSNGLLRSGSLRRSVLLSVNWTAGHLAGAIASTIALFFFRDSILALIPGSFETLVALMLIAFGILGLHQGIGIRYDEHSHGWLRHAHFIRGGKGSPHTHMLGIGLVQGLASNDELLLLLTVFLGLSDLAQMIAGTAVFSAGVLIGMVGFCCVFTLPAIAGRRERVGRALNIVVGLLSIGYGVWMLAG